MILISDKAVIIDLMNKTANPQLVTVNGRFKFSYCDRRAPLDQCIIKSCYAPL